jgi:hypothetical protein
MLATPKANVLTPPSEILATPEAKTAQTTASDVKTVDSKPCYGFDDNKTPVSEIPATPEKGSPTSEAEIRTVGPSGVDACDRDGGYADDNDPCRVLKFL